MEITINLPDELFDDDEWIRLRDFFNRKPDEDDILMEDIQKFIPVALKEYIDMIVGRGFPSRADEIRQNRLFYLIKYYDKKLISESDVSKMFQESESKSKSMIRFVITRFRYDLKKEIENAIIDIICAVEHNNSENNPAYHVTIQSDIVVEELNRVIKKAAPKYHKVKKIPGTSIRYSIPEESCCKLKELYCPEEEDCDGCPIRNCSEFDESE